LPFLFKHGERFLRGSNDRSSSVIHRPWTTLWVLDWFYYWFGSTSWTPCCYVVDPICYDVDPISVIHRVIHNLTVETHPVPLRLSITPAGPSVVDDDPELDERMESTANSGFGEAGVGADRADRGPCVAGVAICSVG
jgi:hypothetical protein